MLVVLPGMAFLAPSAAADEGLPGEFAGQCNGVVDAKCTCGTNVDFCNQGIRCTLYTGVEPFRTCWFG